jgi:glycerol kinase
MQIQSNILNNCVVRPKITETTALGAAFLSGLATGFFKDLDTIESLWEKDKLFKPENKSSIAKVKSLWKKRMSQILG